MKLFAIFIHFLGLTRWAARMCRTMDQSFRLIYTFSILFNLLHYSNHTLNLVSNNIRHCNETTF